MEVIWIALIAFVSLVGVALLVGGAVVLISRFSGKEPIRVSLRFLLRLYLYVVIIAGLLVFTQGASSLLRAGFAGIGGKDFSYNPVYVPLPEDSIRDTPTAVELKGQQLLTEADREKLSQIYAERDQKRLELDKKRRRLGLDRALDEGIIEGVSFILIGALIWGAHVVGRRRLETKEDEESPLNRIYLILITVIFGVITIVNLPQAVFESLRFGLLDPVSQFGHTFQPGGKLALSITALPIWLIYLWGSIRAVRKSPR